MSNGCHQELSEEVVLQCFKECFVRTICVYGAHCKFFILFHIELGGEGAEIRVERGRGFATSVKVHGGNDPVQLHHFRALCTPF